MVDGVVRARDLPRQLVYFYVYVVGHPHASFEEALCEHSYAPADVQHINSLCALYFSYIMFYLFYLIYVR